MDRTSDTSGARAERLVGPSKGLSPEEDAYWDEYNALVESYIMSKNGEVEPEGLLGLYALGEAPWFRLDNGDPWPDDWSERFDAQTLAHIRGRDLLMQQVAEGGLMEGDDETIVVDEIAAFAAWLGREGHVPAAVAEGFCNEIAAARPAFLEATAEVPDDGP